MAQSGAPASSPIDTLQEAQKQREPQPSSSNPLDAVYAEIEMAVEKIKQPEKAGMDAFKAALEVPFEKALQYVRKRWDGTNKIQIDGYIESLYKRLGEYADKLATKQIFSFSEAVEPKINALYDILKPPQKLENAANSPEAKAGQPKPAGPKSKRAIHAEQLQNAVELLQNDRPGSLNLFKTVLTEIETRYETTAGPEVEPRIVEYCQKFSACMNEAEAISILSINIVGLGEHIADSSVITLINRLLETACARLTPEQVAAAKANLPKPTERQTIVSQLVQAILLLPTDHAQSLGLFKKVLDKICKLQGETNEKIDELIFEYCGQLSSCMDVRDAENILTINYNEMSRLLHDHIQDMQAARQIDNLVELAGKKSPKEQSKTGFSGNSSNDVKDAAPPAQLYRNLGLGGQTGDNAEGKTTPSTQTPSMQPVVATNLDAIIGRLFEDVEGAMHQFNSTTQNEASVKGLLESVEALMPDNLEIIVGLINNRALIPDRYRAYIPVASTSRLPGSGSQLKELSLSHSSPNPAGITLSSLLTPDDKASPAPAPRTGGQAPAAPISTPGVAPNPAQPKL